MRRVDWFRVVDDINRLGFSISEISNQIDVPLTTVKDWRQGAEPRHMHGERLIALWASATGRGRLELPTEEFLPSAARAR